MPNPIDRIIDAIDIETSLYAKSEEEARELAEGMLAALGLGRGDVVFLEQAGAVARVRLRAYVHHPGDRYRWLENGEGEVKHG